MTPKEKAEELLDKFNLPTGLMSIEIKQCALITVDEMMHQIRFHLAYGYQKQLEYWQQVKNEIEQL
jgi:ribulose bisphosphate carboxylase small subunit